jgi:hypothetical protein
MRVDWTGSIPMSTQTVTYPDGLKTINTLRYVLACLVYNKGLECSNYQDYEQDATINATKTTSLNDNAEVCPDPRCQLEEDESTGMNQEFPQPDVDIEEL